MELFDFILFFGPFSHFLIFHQFSSHVKGSFIRDGRKGVLKPGSFPIVLDHVEDVDGCG